MASCPALSTEDGKLILSTDATEDGTFVVIGCSGFGRHKTTPTSVLCVNGAWSPTPTLDCETGFDERERLLLGIFIACGVLALIVLLLLCCSCCFFRRRRKFYGWWGRRWSGDRILLDRGSRGYGSYPRETIIRREIIRPDYDDFPSDRSRRYSWEFGRMKKTMYPSESITERRETYRPSEDYRSARSFGFERRGSFKRSEDFRSGRSFGFERRASYDGPRGRTEVYTREAYLPDYDFFEDKLINRESGWRMHKEEFGKSRRYSDGYENPQLIQYKRTRRHSDGSAVDLRRSRQYVTSGKQPLYYETIESSPAFVEYAHAQTAVQPIMAPIVTQEVLEPSVEYVEKPVTYSYTASYLTGGEINPFVLDDEVIMKYNKFGTSFTTLPRARITELPDSNEMHLVPFRSSKIIDPTSYFLGRNDVRYDSWYV